MLFVILALAIRAGALARPGRVFGIFLIGYALARVLLEDFRQADAQFVTPDNPHGHSASVGLDHGPALVAADARGGALVLRSRGRRAGLDRARRADLRARIAAEGPLRLDAYMALCLAALLRDPRSAGRGRRLHHRAGDQPDVRRADRRLAGAGLGRPGAARSLRARRARPGPRHADARRAARRARRCRASATRRGSGSSRPARRLRARQAATLAAPAPRWADRLEELPPGPLFLVANEFFDALPIRQFQRTDALWRERQVGLAGGRLAFAWAPPRPDAALDARFPRLPDGAVAEVEPRRRGDRRAARRADRRATAARR